MIHNAVKWISPILMILIALVGCDKTDQSSSSFRGEDQFRLGDGFRLDFGAELSSNSEWPSLETVLVRCKSEIYGSDSFSHRSSKSVEGRLTFDISRTDSKGELLIYGLLKPRSGTLGDLSSWRVEVIEERVPNEAIDKWVARAIERLVEQLDGQAKVGQSSREDLPGWTRHRESLVRWAAVVELGERGTSGHCGTVVDRLKDKQPTVRLAAAGTLVRLGCSAVDELIEATAQLSRERRPEVIPVIRLLGDIGGPKAINFLETLREGHGSSEVRKAASDAMDQDARQ